MTCARQDSKTHQFIQLVSHKHTTGNVETAIHRSIEFTKYGERIFWLEDTLNEKNNYFLMNVNLTKSVCVLCLFFLYFSFIENDESSARRQNFFHSSPRVKTLTCRFRVFKFMLLRCYICLKFNRN